MCAIISLFNSFYHPIGLTVSTSLPTQPPMALTRHTCRYRTYKLQAPRPQSGDPSPTWVLIPRFSPLRGIARLAGGSAPVFIGSNFICPAACQTELSMLVNYYPKHSPQTARIDLIRSGLCICYP